MNRVGIELPDMNISGVNLSHPENGNPGVGGSEYLFVLLAKLLAENGYVVTMLHYSKNVLPDGVREIIVKDELDLIESCPDDILIHQVGKSAEWYERLSKSKLKAVAWAHIYLEYPEQRSIIHCPNVKRVVCVGKEEYDAYIDSDIIKKSTYIYNMVPMRTKTEIRELDTPTVTYVGSLVPAKGFHKLARNWPKIIKKVPNAELNVIGTGRVYNRNSKLGKYEIAQEDYEQSFMKYLTDSNGSILSSVHFLGIVGEEKKDIFKRTWVGVANPTALTETFCMSAVEMEYSYVPVVSRGKWGLLDTIQSGKTGYLFHSDRQFVNYIVKLLSVKNLNESMGQAAHKFAYSSFNADFLIDKWRVLIDEVSEDKQTKYLGVKGNNLNDFKWVKRIIRVIRFHLKISVFPSFEDIKHFLKVLLKR